MIARCVRIVGLCLITLVPACSSADDDSDPTSEDPPASEPDDGTSGAGEPAPMPSADTDGPPVDTSPDPNTAMPPVQTPSLATVSPLEASEVIDRAPEGLVVLDVRTPAEFAEGHLADAILVDFYAPDFESQLAELDPSLPYVLYCRSGNRSGQTMPVMERLGFLEVYEVDGGIVAWMGASLPVVVP